jgi:fatty acid-binding protein DegV
MAHFTITLPDQQQADVRSGKIRKINLNIRQLLRLSPVIKEENKGYIVKLAHGQQEYHLLKTIHGKWLRNREHPWIKEAEEPVTAAIRQAIEEHEKQQNLS